MFSTASGIPINNFGVGSTGPFSGRVSIATAGTLALEWSRLSDLTGDPKYGLAALNAYKHFLKPSQETSLWPGLRSTYIDVDTGAFSTPYSGGWGGENDSYYEYLIKLAIYATHEELRKSWEAAVNSTIKYLSSSPEGQPDVTMIGEFQHLTEENKDGRDAVVYRSGHLACFAGGNFILGSSYVPAPLSQQFLDFGLRVTDGCHFAAVATPMGITPEQFSWTPASTNATSGGEIKVISGDYILRPEVVESYYYAWMATHDEKYRTWAWQFFEILEKHCKSKYGYSSFAANFAKTDSQESFLFAETFKYLYLIFADSELLSLRDFVFNTEGHPIRIKYS